MTHLLRPILIGLAILAGLSPVRADIYQQLDEAIARTDTYMDQRRARIGQLLQTLQTTHADEARYEITYRLFEEYHPYKNDSALVYIDRCRQLAQAAGHRALAERCKAIAARECSVAGMYNEATDQLKAIDRSLLDRRGLIDYYIACNHVYGELFSYSKRPQMAQRYHLIANAYRDSIFLTADPHSEDYLMRRETVCLDNRQYDRALQINDERLRATRQGSHERGIVAYYRHLIYKAMGREAEARQWLAQSALCDVRNAVTDQASLWTLARILSDEGQVERAFTYISYAWRAAQTFNARLRGWQISPIMSTIDTSYQREINRTNRRLLVSFVVASLLALLSLTLLYYSHRQRRRLAETRNLLAENNEQLAQMNGRLKAMNRQLDEANKSMQTANDHLHESNRLKEEYIGQFLTLCSMYIDRMDKLRIKAAKLIKAKQYDALIQMTRDDERRHEELGELYENFDHVFLRLFPHFVDDFNSLLVEEHRIRLADPTKLNTPLRVFALIRLGVEDSSKIAEVLHYSLNTIYNYRAKYRNAALGDRNELEHNVKLLGTIKG